MLTAEEKEHLLTAHPLHYLEIHELDMLIAYSRHVSFIPGQFLTHQGKMGEGMYVIMRGEATVSARTLGIGVLDLTTIRQGDFVGEVSLIMHTPLPVSVIAKTHLDGLLITHHYFDLLSLFFPKIRYKIVRAITEVICTRLQRFHHAITRLMQRTHASLTEAHFAKRIKTMTTLQETSFKQEGIDSTRLRSSSFFKGLTDTEYSILLAHSHLVMAPKHCCLIKSTDMHPAAYFIICGAVQSNIISANRIVKLSVLAPTSFFGSSLLVSDQPTYMTYIACERVLLLRLSSSDLLAFADTESSLWYKLYDIICTSFVEVERAASKLYLRLNSELYNQ